jgi:hypothetical protein
MTNTTSPNWNVRIERQGMYPCRVEFAVYDDKDEPEIGYADDLALAVALGSAIKAVTPGDEQPWRLAVVVNLLDWLDKYDGSPELAQIASKAREVWRDLSPGAEAN